MYLLIIFLPLLGFILTSIFAKIIGKQGVNIIILIFITLSSILSFIIFYEIVLSHNICIISLTK